MGVEFHQRGQQFFDLMLKVEIGGVGALRQIGASGDCRLRAPVYPSLPASSTGLFIRVTLEVTLHAQPYTATPARTLHIP
jgi:hypothetical protein